MKTRFKTIVALLVIINIVCCSKKTEQPEQKCRTCIAKDNIEGVTIDSKEVCNDADENSFRSTHAEFIVSCK